MSLFTTVVILHVLVNVVGESQFITVGLWGDLDVGDSFKHKGFDGIKTVKVCSSDSGIHSIEVQYTKDGKDTEPFKAGSNDGCAQEQCSFIEEVILLQHGEYINNVYGYYGPYLEDKRIRSLAFTTNKSTQIFGPYGEKGNGDEKSTTKFFVKKGRIVGFYGKASSYISAIGFYVLPQLNASSKEEQLIEVGFWGKRTPQSFKHWGYEGIKSLKIRHSAVIDSIEVKFRNGERFTQGGLGGDENPKQIFEGGEYINKVIGHYGKFKLDRESDNVETINQLTFTTNKIDKKTEKPRVLGPHGKELETYHGNKWATKFSVKGGRIVGFQGTGGRYISSIGFYILP